MARPAISRDDIQGTILLYLRRFPQARDSLRGVATWCEIILGVRPAETLVREVIEEMTAAGTLAVAMLADGTRIYGLPPPP